MVNADIALNVMYYNEVSLPQLYVKYFNQKNNI